MKTTVQWLVRAIIGIFIIVGLLSIISPQAFIESIRSLNIVCLILAIIVYSGTFLLLSERWRYILHHMGIRVSHSTAYQAFIAGVLVSDYTPARVGDLSRVLMLNKTIDRKRTTISVILDRLFDICTIAALGTCGILIIGIKGVFIHSILAPLLIIFTGIPVLIFALWRYLPSKRIQKIMPRRFSCIIEEMQTGFIPSLKTKGICWCFILTVLAWITHALRVLLVVVATGNFFSYLTLFCVQPLISALSLIPISIGGLGLVEGGLTAVLSEGGILLTTAILIAFIDRALTMIFHLVVGGQYLIRNPLNPPFDKNLSNNV
jgi:glycosyltransferase 2 family protein